MNATEAQNDRKILKILCKDMYYLMNEIVQKYATKQEEKTILAGEELFAKSIYRDCFDQDLAADFSLLYKDDCFVISAIQNIKPNSKKSFQEAIQSIIQFVQQQDNKQQLGLVAQKYKKSQDKFEWIFNQAIKKLDGYTQKMNDQECESSRVVLLDLVIAIIQFQVSQSSK